MIHGIGCGPNVQIGPSVLGMTHHLHIASAACIVEASSAEEAFAASVAIAEGDVLCGWAFDAGMREAERDAAVAAERAKHAELRELLAQVTPWVGYAPFQTDKIAEVHAVRRRILEILEED